MRESLKKTSEIHKEVIFFESQLQIVSSFVKALVPSGKQRQ